MSARCCVKSAQALLMDLRRRRWNGMLGWVGGVGGLIPSFIVTDGRQIECI